MDFTYCIKKKCLDGACGIYSIRRKNTEKYYVGSSINIYYRIARHKSDLKAGRHSNKHLQNSFKKHGGACSFEVDFLEECDESKLVERENHWIEQLDCLQSGYNQCKVTEARKNQVSQKTRSQISKTLMGGKSVLMYDISTDKLERKFASLYDAAEYILENGLSKSKSASHVRMKISETIRSKVVSTGKYTGRRRTAYGFKWRTK